MLKITKLVVILIVGTLGLSACYHYRHPVKTKYVVITEDVKENMEEFDTQITILVDSDNNFVAVDNTGDPLQLCSVGPVGEDEKVGFPKIIAPKLSFTQEQSGQHVQSKNRRKINQDKKIKQCRSFEKGGRVLDMKTITIFTGQGSRCNLVASGGNNVAGQSCWYPMELTVTAAKVEIKPGNRNDIAVIKGEFSLTSGGVIDIQEGISPRIANSIYSRFNSRSRRKVTTEVGRVVEPPGTPLLYRYVSSAPTSSTANKPEIEFVEIRYPTVPNGHHGTFKLKYHRLNLPGTRTLPGIIPLTFVIGRNRGRMVHAAVPAGADPYYKPELHFHDAVSPTPGVHKYCVKIIPLGGVIPVLSCD